MEAVALDVETPARATPFTLLLSEVLVLAVLEGPMDGPEPGCGSLDEFRTTDTPHPLGVLVVQVRAPLLLEDRVRTVALVLGRLRVLPTIWIDSAAE